MPNPKMMSFCHLEAPSKSERHVVWRIGQKTLFFVPNISKMQKVPQIF